MYLKSMKSIPELELNRIEPGGVQIEGMSNQ